jgi:hypothetical protein
MKTLIIGIITALAVSMAPAAAAKDRMPPDTKRYQLPECIGPCAPYYTKRAERVLRCIAWRESSMRWDIDGPYGSGSFQLIGSTSRAYAKKLGLDAYASYRAYLWPPAVQTYVAYAMLNADPDKPGLEGLFHWSPVWATTIGASTYSCADA